MNETAILQKCRLKLSKLGYKMSRNNCGALRDENGRVVKFGTFSPGGADLLGWRTVKITAEHIGENFAQFVAVECKVPGKKPTPEQQHFLDTVKAAGGIAYVARSENDII